MQSDNLSRLEAVTDVSVPAALDMKVSVKALGIFGQVGRWSVTLQSTFKITYLWQLKLDFAEVDIIHSSYRKFAGCGWMFRSTSWYMQRVAGSHTCVQSLPLSRA
eukprot:2072793-Amphidinium_carterae.2